MLLNIVLKLQTPKDNAISTTLYQRKNVEEDIEIYLQHNTLP